MKEKKLPVVETIEEKEKRLKNQGVLPCKENTYITDGNKINPNTGLSKNAKILME